MWQDYLLAPMPFLVGVPAAQQFTALRSIPLEEVMLVDLDAGTCTPGADLPAATPSSLPYAEELCAALQVLAWVCRAGSAVVVTLLPCMEGAAEHLNT